jgi:hypothetical protein
MDAPETQGVTRIDEVMTQAWAMRRAMVISARPMADAAPPIVPPGVVWGARMAVYHRRPWALRLGRQACSGVHTSRTGRSRRGRSAAAKGPGADSPLTVPRQGEMTWLLMRIPRPSRT